MLKQKKIAGTLGVMMITLTTLYADNIKPNGCDGPILCSPLPIAAKRADCCYSWHVGVGVLYQQPAFSFMDSGVAYTPVFQNPTSTSSPSFKN
jgi:hypothetical protein